MKKHYKGYYCTIKNNTPKFYKVDKTLKLKSKEQKEFFSEMIQPTKTKAVNFAIKLMKDRIKDSLVIFSYINNTKLISSMKIQIKFDKNYLKKLNKLKNSL